jgi:hypothetical protein
MMGAEAMTQIRIPAILLAGLAAAATSATAQVDPQTLCAGLGAEGVWVGGSSEASDVSLMEAPADLTAELGTGQQSVALFRLSAPAELRLEAAPREAGDTEIELRAAGGAVLLTDDDGGGGLSSRAETALEPGTYCLVTRGLSGTAVSADIRIGLTSHAALTEGATSRAVSTACTDPTAEILAPVIDWDDGYRSEASVETLSALRFTLDEARAISIRAENTDADPVLQLFDPNGSMIAENDDFDGLNAQIDISERLEPGRYCIGINALSDVTLPVVLTIEVYDAEAAMMRLYATGAASPPLDGPVAIADLGTLDTRMMRDITVGGTASWFSFTMAEDGLALINVITLSDGGDPEAMVFDDLGRELARNDDSGGGLDSQIATELTPGTYVLGVRDISDGTGAPMRLALQRFIPAE